MALTRPRKEREKLEANNRIHVKNQVSRSQIVPGSDTITFPVNIRVDNHIRNQVTALINLGVESNMKRMVADMLNVTQTAVFYKASDFVANGPIDPNNYPEETVIS